MKTVLIVDDSVFMRNMIKDHISELDVQVIGEAENGIIAVEKYIELKPDIVTLDLAMFEYDGIEAMKDIMKHDPEASIIIVSSTADQESVIDEAMSLGARTIINKPISKEEILGVFNELIAE